jgi:succinate dehydrogenase/fumarate reductase-like Fe-S protein
MMRRAVAWLNLAWHFALHCARLPLRLLRRGYDVWRFLETVEPEGYVPLPADTREAYASFMTCIGCGLCTLACPVLRQTSTSAWEEAWTFVVGPSRSIDRASLLDAPACTRCGECSLACPMEVPIPRLVALVSLGRTP